MSDTVHNIKTYMKFTSDEFMAFLVTGFFAAVILNFRNWGDETFNMMTGIQATLLSFMLILLILIATVWLCKVIAIRLGYTIEYKSHLPGLVIGVFICVISNGYLPIFLPGGFEIQQPHRLAIGKYHPFRRGWELGLIAGTFPLIMLLWVLILNPLYLLTHGELFLRMTVTVCLFAIYACLPVPFFDSHHKGNLRDWFRYLHGASFGLEVAYASFSWYIVLCCTVLFFALVAFLLTVLDTGAGIVLYVLSFLVGLFCLWVYSKFYKYHRHSL